MASLSRRSSGLYLLSFRYDGRQFQRSLETSDPEEASRAKVQFEKRVDLLRDGTLRLPPGAAPDDLWQLLLTGQAPQRASELIRPKSLVAVGVEYLKSYPKGSKEANTLKTERVHLNNFERIVGGRIQLHSVQAEHVLRYIDTRLGEKGNRGGTIKADTVRKELQTIRLLWQFAKRSGYVAADCPVNEVERPKRRQKPPFQTWEEIESAIARSGYTSDEAAQLWEGLYLREIEVAEFLEHVRIRSKSLHRFPYIYPALCFCAYTGARRSEMFRALVEDVSENWVLLREKKRNRDANISFRSIPMHPELSPIVNESIGRSSSRYLFCKNDGQALDDRTSREAFEVVTKASKWNVLKGYHLLRHSFASNLARSGRVSQAEISELMGHKTEEMRQRYQHLFPEDKARAVSTLSFRPTRSA